MRLVGNSGQLTLASNSMYFSKPLKSSEVKFNIPAITPGISVFQLKLCLNKEDTAGF